MIWSLLAIVTYALLPRFVAMDDAYTTLHSARVALGGRDTAYGTPALTGITCPPYVALLSLLVALHVPAIRCASALGIVAFISGIWALGGALGVSRWRTASLVVLVMTSGYTLVHVSNGIETGWALALLTWLLVCAQRRAVIAGGILAGTLPMLRPDLAPSAGVVLVYMWGTGTWPQRRRLLAAAALAAAPWIMWVRIDTGFWWPQTMRAKTVWFADSCLGLNGKWIRAKMALDNVFDQLFPAWYGLAGLLTRPLGWLGMASLGATIAVFVVVFPGGLSHNYFRYPYAFILPWIIFGLALILRYVPGSRLVTVAFAALAAFSVYRMPRRMLDQSYFAGELVAMSTWLDAHTPEDAVILVHDAGAPSEFAHRRLVDIVGLKTPESISTNVRWQRPSSCSIDRSKAIAEIARRAGASYLVTVADWNRLFGLSSALEQEHFAVTAVRQPSIPIGYTVYRIEDRASP